MIYQDKIGSGKWTAKESKSDEDTAFSLTSNRMMCFNCGGLGHGEEAIAARKKLLQKDRSDNPLRGKNKNPKKDKEEEKNFWKQRSKEATSEERRVPRERFQWCKINLVRKVWKVDESHYCRTSFKEKC